MAFNLDKLAKMSVPRSEKATQRATFRKDNREWLSMSHDIALTLHYYLRNAKMTQKELAEKMGVSPAYIGKVLKGNALFRPVQMQVPFFPVTFWPMMVPPVPEVPPK